MLCSPLTGPLEIAPLAALLGEDLLLDVLKQTASRPDGLRVLVDMFDLAGEVQLSQGDKLRMASSLV